MNHIVLKGGEYGLEIYAEVVEEALVLRIYQSTPEDGIYLLVFHRGTVLAEVLAYQHTVVAV